jgi:ABC-type enterochelin transport system substrate-binding protein
MFCRKFWRTNTPKVTEDVKEQIRRQVDQTAEAYKNDQEVDVEMALRDPNYLFVVDTQVSVLSEANTTCQLSGGDILKAVSAPSSEAGAARMMVVTSKGDSCAAGTVVVMSVEDLQEMINTFSEKVDDGLNEVQNKFIKP